MHTLDLSDRLSSAIGSPRDQHALAPQLPRSKPPYGLSKNTLRFQNKIHREQSDESGKRQQEKKPQDCIR